MPVFCRFEKTGVTGNSKLEIFKSTYVIIVESIPCITLCFINTNKFTLQLCATAYIW